MTENSIDSIMEQIEKKEKEKAKAGIVDTNPSQEEIEAAAHSQLVIQQIIDDLKAQLEEQKKLLEHPKSKQAEALFGLSEVLKLVNEWNCDLFVL